MRINKSYQPALYQNDGVRLQFNTNSFFNFIHTTKVFRIEFDLIKLSTANYNRTVSLSSIIANSINTSQLGFSIRNTNTGIQFRFQNADGLDNIITWTLTDGLKDDKWHNYKFVANSTVIELFIDNVSQGTGNITQLFPSGNSTYNLQLAYGSTTDSRNNIGYIKNLKIYNTTDTSGLLFYAKLQNVNAIG